MGTALTDEYEAEYLVSPAPFPGNLPPSGIAHVSGYEHWYMNHSGSATATDVSLYWKDADRSEIYNISSSDLMAAHYNASSSKWEEKGLTICPGSTTGAGGSGCVTGTFTSFSPIAMGSKNGSNLLNNLSPLPISLLDFEASSDNGKVKLDWITGNESNNDFFTVERSADGEIFEELITVKGAGNSNTFLSYTAIDS